MADDLATLQARLAEAEAARHKLAIGKGVAVVNYDGKGQVTYSKAELPALESYISSLRSRIAALQGEPSQRLGPIYAIF